MLVVCRDLVLEIFVSECSFIVSIVISGIGLMFEDSVCCSSLRVWLVWLLIVVFVILKLVVLIWLL